MAIAVNLTVLPSDEPEAQRAVEAISRIATGLAFDGITVSIAIGTYEPDDDGDPS